MSDGLIWTTQQAKVQLRGRLDRDAALANWMALERWKPDQAIREIDVSAVDYCDSAGAAWLSRLHERATELAGSAPVWTGRSSAIDTQLSPFERLAEVAAERDRTAAPAVQNSPWKRVKAVIQKTGAETAGFIDFLGATVAALATVLRHPARLRWRDFMTTAEQAGFRALPIVSLIAFLLGVILAFQGAVSMQQFGAQIFVANLVALSLLRELGPLMMAILLAGRTGAAFAAEIGTMRVNEEVSALTTMALDPVRFLVVPRLLATIIVAPLLAIYANIVGLIGAAVVMQGFGIPFVTFFNQAAGAVSLTDLNTGLFKAVVFGFLIALIGTWRGLETRAGAAAVGESTTRAVVLSIIAIVIVDGLFAVLFYLLGW
ncbi:MAG: ABC transporter permease [Thioalkalivibrionaceae bacterium]